MLGIIGVAVLLVVLGLSLVVTRIATVALTMTGLGRETARFQARSAFTGTGFTTHEAESIVGHPVRRRIIMMLMVIRSAGLVTIVISLLFSFVGPGEDIYKLYRLGGLALGVLLIWSVTRSAMVERMIENLVNRALARWTRLPVGDYAGLLRLSGEYTIMQINVSREDWLEEKTVSDCFLSREGINLLGITREDGSYVGVPGPETKFHANDELILYGREDALQSVSERKGDPRGDAEHEEAVREQEVHERRQEEEEMAQEEKREEKKRNSAGHAT
jgi:hypothetical protein